MNNYNWPPTPPQFIPNSSIQPPPQFHQQRPIWPPGLPMNNDQQPQQFQQHQAAPFLPLAAANKENCARQELLIRELNEQCNQCKNMYAQLNARAGMSSNASTASKGTPALQAQPQTLSSTPQADLVLWKTKAEQLQETLDYLNEERQTHEKILNDRIDNQLEQISQLQNDIEFQNENQQLLDKQIDTYSLDLKQSSEQLTEAKQQVETLQSKCDNLTSQLVEKQQELTTFRVQNHSLTEQLQFAADSIQFGTLQRQQLQSVKDRLESELKTSKETVEELRNNLTAKETELLCQAKQLGDANIRLEEMGAKHEQQLMVAEKENHEAKLTLEQLREANANFFKDIENLNTKCAEKSAQNLRLTADLGTKISENEQLNVQIADIKSKHESEGEMLQRSIDALQQVKMRQQDEINNLNGRDKENTEKQTLLYDEIQQLLKQIETMEHLQNVITSPSPNTSLNASAMTSATFSPTYNRLSMPATEGQQQHADQLDTMGYMRAEKQQKAMELRTNAELDSHQIRTQAGLLDQQRIVQHETELTALRAKAAEVPCCSSSSPSDEPDRAELLYQPGHLGAEAEQQYVNIVRNFREFALMSNKRITPLEKSAQTGGLLLDDALTTFPRSGYSIVEAISTMQANDQHLTSANSFMSADDVKKFGKGIKQYGKDFNKINKELLPHHSREQLVAFYYLWKKSPDATRPKPLRSTAKRNQVPVGRQEKKKVNEKHDDKKQAGSKKRVRPAKRANSVAVALQQHHTQSLEGATSSGALNSQPCCSSSAAASSSTSSARRTKLRRT